MGAASTIGTFLGTLSQGVQKRIDQAHAEEEGLKAERRQALWGLVTDTTGNVSPDAKKWAQGELDKLYNPQAKKASGKWGQFIQSVHQAYGVGQGGGGPIGPPVVGSFAPPPSTPSPQVFPAPAAPSPTPQSLNDLDRPRPVLKRQFDAGPTLASPPPVSIARPLGVTPEQMSGPLYMAPGPTKGLVAPGNIDLRSLPAVDLGEGDWGTVRSMSIEQDGKEVLIPTIVNGRGVSEQEAIAEYKRTGRNLGVFDNPQDADAYAQRLHEDWQAGKIPGVQMVSRTKLTPQGGEPGTYPFEQPTKAAAQQFSQNTPAANAAAAAPAPAGSQASPAGTGAQPTVTAQQQFGYPSLPPPPQVPPEPGVLYSHAGALRQELGDLGAKAQYAEDLDQYKNQRVYDSLPPDIKGKLTWEQKAEILTTGKLSPGRSGAIKTIANVHPPAGTINTATGKEYGPNELATQVNDMNTGEVSYVPTGTKESTSGQRHDQLVADLKSVIKANNPEISEEELNRQAEQQASSLEVRKTKAGVEKAELQAKPKPTDEDKLTQVLLDSGQVTDPAAAKKQAATMVLDLEKAKIKAKQNSGQGVTLTALELNALADWTIATGQTPSFGMGASGNRTAYQKAFAGRLVGKDIGAAALTRSDYKSLSASLSDVEKIRNRTSAFEGTAKSVLARALINSRAVGRTGVPLANEYILYAQGKLEDYPELARFRDDVITAQNEYARVMNSATGGGVSTDSARAEAQQILNMAMAQGSLEAGIDEMTTNLNNRMRNLDESIQDIRSQMAGLGGAGSGTTGGAPAGGGAKPKIVIKSVTPVQ